MLTENLPFFRLVEYSNDFEYIFCFHAIGYINVTTVSRFTLKECTSTGCVAATDHKRLIHVVTTWTQSSLLLSVVTRWIQNARILQHRLLLNGVNSAFKQKAAIRRSPELTSAKPGLRAPLTNYILLSFYVHNLCMSVCI